MLPDRLPERQRDLEHTSSSISNGRGSERFSWKRDLIGFGLVLGLTVISGVAVGGAMSFLAFSLTEGMGSVMDSSGILTNRGGIVLGAATSGILIGMIYGLALGVKLTLGRRSS